MSSSKQTHGRFCSRRATAAGTRGGCTIDCAPAATSRSSNAPTQRARRPSPLATAGSRCPPWGGTPPLRAATTTTTTNSFHCVHATTPLSPSHDDVVTDDHIPAESPQHGQIPAVQFACQIQAAGRKKFRQRHGRRFILRTHVSCDYLWRVARRRLRLYRRRCVSNSRRLDVSSFTHALTHASLNTPYTH